MILHSRALRVRVYGEREREREVRFRDGRCEDREIVLHMFLYSILWGRPQGMKRKREGRGLESPLLA